MDDLFGLGMFSLSSQFCGIAAIDALGLDRLTG